MKTTMKQKWQDVLLRAALIVEEGWCQGVMHLNNDGVNCYRSKATRSCAAGAISRAVGGDYYSTPGAKDVEVAALRGLQRFLRRSQGNSWVTVAVWNDHPGRTATEVAEAMRQAAT